MAATKKRKAQHFELGRWYRVRKPDSTWGWAGIMSDNQLTWTSEMDQLVGKTFQCRRTFFGGKHAFLKVVARRRRKAGAPALDESCGLHIDWVDGPYTSELIAKREEVAASLKAILPKDGGWIKNTSAPATSWGWPDVDIGELWGVNPRGKIELEPGGKCTVKSYSNGQYIGEGDKAQFHNANIGEIQELDTTHKELIMPTNDNWNALTQEENDNWNALTQEERSKLPWLKPATPKWNVTATTSGTTRSVGRHPESTRARSESVVVNGLLYPDGCSSIISNTSSVWFPVDRPEALGLGKIKDELEILIKEGHRILDEVETASKNREKAAWFAPDTNQSLKESLVSVDKKYNSEIDRVWEDFHLRQHHRIAQSRRTEAEIEHAFPPEEEERKSFGWIRWTAIALSLAGIVGSAVYFLL